ncbi:MAG TPA: hypothetical protein VD707_03190 [Gemmatimonadales bacterium]|nr:hypothetical protein [Gemmatimonadales bacterium]
MSPTHKMPEGPVATRAAALTELRAALAAARCASYVAGLATADFAARELLLVTLQEIDRATRAAGKLGD